MRKRIHIVMLFFCCAAVLFGATIPPVPCREALQEIKEPEVTGLEKLSKEEKENRRKMLLSCLLRTSGLLGISTSVSASVRFLINSDSYDLEGLEKAGRDPNFRRQLLFNGMLMSVVGMNACYKTKLGDNSVAGAATTTSAIGQWIATGHVTIPQTLFDTAWIRFVSLYKTRLVMRQADKYKNNGGKNAAAVEAGYQTLSEALGSAGYALTERAINSFFDMH